MISLQRGIYCPGEEIKVNLQYKYVEARKMGLVKCRLNKYKQLNKRENKSVYKKTVKEQNGMYMSLYVHVVFVIDLVSDREISWVEL